MILIDSSVWINHIHKPNPALWDVIGYNKGATHPLVVQELACGNIKNRKDFIDTISSLIMAKTASHNEIISFIELNKLHGIGLSLIDVNLLASALLSDFKVWTDDIRLNNTAKKLGVSYR